MSIMEDTVYLTIEDDGSGRFSAQVDDAVYRFTASEGAAPTEARLRYEETLNGRGEIRVSDPPEDVWAFVMKSEQMSRYLELRNYDKIVRER
jgi:hypothetical protein